ncbi:hypothetical protein L227DRAFT_613906 [Lentinus tigrinus ALCF2SS1-6]|uniref:Uncharacterized protein n=1 Tax=Lentinus tigrinus ALCF2SS1-6 TaxID=1328759 RepID=A0A5C2S1L2_9APHY|nr:hypothetical protein L227DRAFT_613906 [Lentinus tigrinus ALCF2SS1-6]
MDWLNRTDPNNLYPFLHMLPSGNIFVEYYNEARILNPVTFDTRLGRTHEGTAVLLPQHAPYTDPLTLHSTTVFISSLKSPTLNGFLSPSQRVMPCMAGASSLPDGTFLIVNGAHQGVTGFGLATDPNLQALLYDPSQPVGSRISILNDTIVARLYHSEATLLPDGRILISGSDPQGPPPFPEEMRVEVYIPPYLTQGFAQPSFTVDENDWQYGGSYTIHVTLHQGTTANMRVSMIAATSSTVCYSLARAFAANTDICFIVVQLPTSDSMVCNSMGMRTLFPQFSCNGNTCTVIAPPNAFVIPPGWWQVFVLDGPTPSHSNWAWGLSSVPLLYIPPESCYPAASGRYA